MMNTNNSLIPDRSQPGLTMTEPTVRHRGVGDKYNTGVPKIKKIRGRENISVGTWNVRTLRPAGKLKQLTRAVSRYHWNIVGLCEMRWKNFGEMSTDEGHKVYFSGEQDRHEYVVGFLVHKDVLDAVLGCRPVSCRLISIRVRAAPFIITIIQVYAPTSGHDDSEVDHFYQQLQETTDQTPKQDILVVQGDWNAKVGKDAQADWGKVCESYCNVETNERGLRLLECATFNNLVLTNTLSLHKSSRRWSWHSPDGKHHNQIVNILVKKRFRSGVNIHRTRSFPGADIGSDHDLVMMTFRVRLKKARKPNQPRLRFDLEKLRDPDVACTCQATIGGKFAPLIGLSDEDMDINTIVTIYNTAVTDAASEILWKERSRKKPWVTKDVLDLWDERRELKKKRYKAERAKEYREANRRIQKAVMKTKEDWIGAQCEEIETCLNKNNNKRAYQLVKDLTAEKEGRSSAIQDKSGKCLTEEKEILSRWTEYCSELYNYEKCGDNAVLDCSQPPEEDLQPILREEVEIAVASLKKGKSVGVEYIPNELVQAGGETMIDVLTEIFNRIWRTREWPTPWTQSLVITLPKKGNLQLCQNYRAISLISHSSKLMLKVILNRLNSQAEEIIAEEQAGFRAGRSTTEQIFNLRILCEKYLQHQQNLYYVFIDFKKAFDRVWHAALWATMRQYNINANLVRTI